MASIPDPSTIADAEQLVLDLKNDTGSAASHARTMRQMNKLRCRLEQGPDALMHHSFPVHIHGFTNSRFGEFWFLISDSS